LKYRSAARLRSSRARAPREPHGEGLEAWGLLPSSRGAGVLAESAILPPAPGGRRQPRSVCPRACHSSCWRAGHALHLARLLSTESQWLTDGSHGSRHVTCRRGTPASAPHRACAASGVSAVSRSTLPPARCPRHGPPGVGGAVAVARSVGVRLAGLGTANPNTRCAPAQA
jgi:hypothetical protein